MKVRSCLCVFCFFCVKASHSVTGFSAATRFLQQHCELSASVFLGDKGFDTDVFFCQYASSSCRMALQLTVLGVASQSGSQTKI